MPPSLNGGKLRRALVVVNPISGRGLAARAADELAEGLRQRGVQTEVFATAARGDAFTKLRTLAGEGPEDRPAVDVVISVGGDGTLREVMDGLVDPSLPVAMLPVGTANVLAQELGLPRDIHHHLEILDRGRVAAVDVARVNGRLSLLMTGVGFDARAVREVERRRRGPIHKGHYVSAGLRALRGYRPPVLAVSADGAAPRRAGFVIVSNVLHYAGQVRLDPEARMNDGQLEVYLFESGRPLEIFRALLRGVVRTLPGPGVEVLRARTVTVTTEDPEAEAVPFQVDGDLGGETPLEIVVAPNRYRLVVP